MGVVSTQTCVLFEPPDLLQMDSGSKFGPVQVAYETYGQLSPQRDNAVFICHALTGDAHAAGRHTETEKKPGWWDDFIGPGKGIDTDRYFVVCANILGGCQGTTGPSSLNPDTGEPYCLDFPSMTVGDIVSVHSKLCQHLGIERLLAVIGGSLGGMQVLEWSIRFPDQMSSAIVLASAGNLSAQGIAFNAVGRRAILTDPEFQNGRYYQGERPRFGLSLARMIAHITYLSESSIEHKFGRKLQDSDGFAFDLLKEIEFQIESYLHYQGKRFVERFDANSYLYLTKAMDYFDLSESYGSFSQAVRKTNARFLIVSYSSDWLFTTSQSKQLVSALIENGKHATFVELDSPFGHDSFLIDFEPLRDLVKPFLRQALETRRK